MMEFKSFNKITDINKREMIITQKIHGTNAQIYVYEDPRGELDLLTGSRTRWITPGDDNHGFARFVYERKDAFMQALGIGRHFGEWCGCGINSGEGLKEKTLVLFNFKKFNNVALPDRVTTVPVLYSGDYSEDAINKTFEELKANGSRLVPGFMRPEGIVINIDGMLYKKVYEHEETAWKKPERVKMPASQIDISHLFQPIRLDKLLSRDERYIREYPRTIHDICSAYMQDLVEEGQISGDEEEVKAIKKEFGKQAFYFIKNHIQTNFLRS